MAGLRQAWSRFRQAGKAAQIGIGCGALIIVCICASVGLAVIGSLNGGAKGASSNPGGGNAAQATATSAPVVHPTATTPARATTTSSTAQSGAAVLGGPGQAFITKYGPLTSQSNAAQGDLHFKQYPGVALDYLIVDEGQYLAARSGQTDAFSIVVSPPPEQPWTLTQATQACTQFAPGDARHVQRYPVTNGWDDVYSSVTLGEAFAASDFQDANQNAAPVGSFDILYLYASSSDTAHVVNCQLLVGEQQTKG